MTASIKLNPNKTSILAMPATAILHNIQYYELNSNCWCATAQLNPSDSLGSDLTSLLCPSSKPAQLASTGSSLGSEIPYLQSYHNVTIIQRFGVRRLCYALLSHLKIKDEVDDSKYPYRLKQLGYYVCFSHSKEFVAVILHAHHPAAVDIERGDVSLAVAARFYHADDLLELQQLAREDQANVCRMLWQLKECVVKIQQTLLIPTLGQNHADYVAPLAQFLAQNNPSFFRSNRDRDSNRYQDCDSSQDFTQLDQGMTLNTTEYQLAVLPHPAVMIIY